MKYADLILSADWHLRETRPICRIDDYWFKQWLKINAIKELQKEHDCPVIVAGDLTDHWKCNPRLLTVATLNLPERLKVVCGQHDLPQHNLNLINKSALFNLATNKTLEILTTCHYSREPKFDRPSLRIKERSILVWHIMTWGIKRPWISCTAPSARGILKKYPEYDLIVTGDNHKPFVVEYDGRLLVNPGSIMRMDADQINHKPRVYLWYAKTNTVQTVFLPIEPDVISREHIDSKTERDNRIKAFISKLNDSFEEGMSFEDTLEQYAKENKVDKNTLKIIREAIDQ